MNTYSTPATTSGPCSIPAWPNFRRLRHKPTVCSATTSSAAQKSVFFRTVPEQDATKPEAHPVPCIVYPEVSDTGYGIQHIKDKPSLGLAMSGGGFRAATCAAGWTRGLHKMELTDRNGQKVSALSQIKYVATTSGGSWFNSALSYKSPLQGDNQPNSNLDTFLGKVIKPSEMEAKVINSVPEGSFDAVLANKSVLDKLMGSFRFPIIGPITAFIAFTVKMAVSYMVEAAAARLRKEGVQEDPTRRAKWVSYWTNAVAETFLNPYGLNIYSNCTLTASGTKGNILSRAKGNAKHVLTACTDHSRPYPILMGAAFNPPGDDGLRAYPYEFTPLYFGTPGAFPKSAPPLGGGYIEPWALNSKPKSPCEDSSNSLNCACSTGEVLFDNSGTNEIGKPFHTVPLAQAMSISSAFPAIITNTKRPFMQALAATERLTLWGLMGDKGKPPQDGLVSFADGGMVDNLGITALLRRGVKCLIVCSAASAGPDDTWERYAAESCDVACWFGAARTCLIPGIPVAQFNDNNHVFGASRREGEQLFQDLFDDVYTKLRAGKPGFHRNRYTVRQNRFHNIPGEQEVEVLWIFNHQWGDWEDKLPREVKQMLDKDRAGQNIHPKGVMERLPFEGEIFDFGGFGTQNNLKRFPYFTTFSLDFSNSAVNMLSQLSSAVIMDESVQEQIQDLLNSAAAGKYSKMQEGPLNPPTFGQTVKAVADA